MSVDYFEFASLKIYLELIPLWAAGFSGMTGSASSAVAIQVPNMKSFS